MRTEFDKELEERLVRYAAIDTQSDETCRIPQALRSSLTCKRCCKLNWWKWVPVTFS